jgi:hypothetical protein
MICQHVSALGLFFKGLSEGLVNIDIGDVAVFEDNTEELKLLI